MDLETFRRTNGHSYRSFEPLHIPNLPIEELPAPIAVIEAEPEDQDGAPVELNEYEGSAGRTLAPASCFQPCTDHMGQDERHHRSAELLLYPQDEHYQTHLRWICDFTDFPLHYLRATLDRLRPQWDKARRRVKQ